MTNYMDKLVKTDAFGAWELRNTAYVRGLPPEKRAELQDAVKRHNNRRQNQPFSPGTLAIVQAEASQAESKQVVKTLLKRLYKMPSCRWAGGEAGAWIDVSMKPFALGEATAVWSRNGKWKGNNAYFKLNIQPAWCKYVEKEGLASAGGLLTTHARRIAPDAWSAAWVEQGRGFDLKARAGVIIKAYGRFFHGGNEAQARRKVKGWEKKADQLGLLEHAGVSVTLQDAIAVSNCPTGSRAFASRFFPGRDFVTVAELIDHLPFSPFVAQAIYRAIARANAK